MITAQSQNSPTIAVLREGIDSGLHIGAQLVAMVRGKVVADIAIGNCRLAHEGGGDVPMEPGTLMVWLSAGKPLTAVAMAMLVEQGKITLDDRVADFIPDFAQHEKGTITLRHLLTHTAGIRGIDGSYPFATWEETIAKINAVKMERDWLPGEKAGYHAHTSWYVLGELIRVITGERVENWVRKNVLIPAGMIDTHMAMSAEQYDAYSQRVGYLYDTTISPSKPIPNYDTELGVSRARPSGSCRGPIRELARFYEMLRRGGEIDGHRLLRHETVKQWTSPQRVSMFDQTFRQTLDWGFGFIINSSQYGLAIPYQFGTYASPGTFGHGGSQSSSGFCDSTRDLVVGVVFDGCPGEPAHDRRFRATIKTLYEELFGL